jgi:hypothetical protein
MIEGWNNTHKNAVFLGMVYDIVWSKWKKKHIYG